MGLRGGVRLWLLGKQKRASEYRDLLGKGGFCPLRQMRLSGQSEGRVLLSVLIKLWGASRKCLGISGRNLEKSLKLGRGPSPQCPCCRKPLPLHQQISSKPRGHLALDASPRLQDRTALHPACPNCSLPPSQTRGTFWPSTFRPWAVVQPYPHAHLCFTTTCRTVTTFWVHPCAGPS